MANDLQIRVLLSALDKVTAPLKRIAGGGNATARALKAARDRVKELNQQQQDISAYQRQREAVRQSAEALAKGQEKLRAYREQLKAMDAPSAAFQKTFANTAAAVDKLQAKHTAQRTELQRLLPVMRASGVDTRDLGGAQARLQAQLTSANAAIDTQRGKLERLNRMQEKLASVRNKLKRGQEFAGNAAMAGASSAATGAAIGGPVLGMIKAFAPAEDAATQLRASLMLSDGTAPKEFKEISDLATRLGDRLPGTTAEFQEMMTMLVRQGMSAKTILGGMGEAAAYLGVQLKMPVTEAAEFAAKMQDATRTSEKDLMSLMDTIQRGFYLGVESNNMLEGFSKISPALDIIKKEGLEAANALAPLLIQLDQTGMEGGAAGNALRKIFQMGMDTDKVGKANKGLKDKGIKLDFTDGKGEFGGMEKLYAQLDKLKGLNTETRLGVLKQVFGDDSETLTALNTLMSKGLAGYQEVQGKMKAQADLQMRVNEQLKTVTNLWDAATGSFTNAQSQFGAAVAPQLKEIITWLTDAASATGAWAEANPTLAGNLVKVAAVISAVSIAFGTVALGVAGVLGPFLALRFMLAQVGIRLPNLIGLLFNLGKTALPLVAAGFRLLGAAVMANPIAAIILSLVTAGSLLYANWSTVGPWFRGLWEEMKTGVRGGITGIAKLILDFSPIGLFYRAFAAVMNYFGVELPAKFTDLGGMMMQGLVNGITSGLGAVKNAVMGAGESAINFFKEKLGIHSPSRVFASLGEFTMQGLAIGLGKGEGSPLAQIADTAKRIASAGAVALGVGTAATPALANGITFDDRPAMSAAAPAAPAGGDAYHITINAGAGTDAQAIAREVQAALARIESQKAARSRSSLKDRT
ncbi:TP901 family phage tail tape measure protein [Pseudomonas sp. SORGH_AS199]|uniref:phage tail tape measure protein n=1 Tax=Pseudomonas sp. SORGH_AS_0199 TaxID=3041761 RepID=UPI00285F812C|nr:phage tail tape measure protein [Pseudomonas sp. SORGH_AS_0199]MDR6230453.1 TP901 family phage tail tape measure protein [Pseudomonas sp. SORGH_AS_0199]